MTDDTLESAQEDQGQEAEVAPKVPEVSGDKRTSTEPVDTTALVKALVPALRDALVKDEDFVRASQAAKDRRLSVLDEIDKPTLQRFKRYLEKFNGDEDEAIRQVMIDKELTKRQEQAPDARESVGRKQPEATLTQWVSTELKKFGISSSDPRYEALVEQFEESPGSEADFKAAVRVFISQARASTQVPASAVAASSGAGRNALSNDALTQAYIKEMNASAGKGMAIGREIREKYRSKGVDVDRVVLA